MAYNTTSDRISGNILDNAQASLGKKGLDFVKGTSEATIQGGVYGAVQFVTESKVSALTIGGCNLFNDECNLGGSAVLTSSTVIPAGTILYGNITAITLADSNSFAILYKL